MNFFEERHLLHFLLGAVRFHVLDFELIPNQDPQSPRHSLMLSTTPLFSKDASQIVTHDTEVSTHRERPDGPLVISSADARRTAKRRLPCSRSVAYLVSTSTRKYQYP